MTGIGEGVMVRSRESRPSVVPKQHEKSFELFVTSRLNACSGLEANWPNSLSKDDKAQSFIR